MSKWYPTLRLTQKIWVSLWLEKIQLPQCSYHMYSDSITTLLVFLGPSGSQKYIKAAQFDLFIPIGVHLRRP